MNTVLKSKVKTIMGHIMNQSIIKFIHAKIVEDDLDVGLYLFGGAVRDLIADTPIKDYDILVQGVMRDVNHLFHTVNRKFGQFMGGVVNYYVEDEPTDRKVFNYIANRSYNASIVSNIDFDFVLVGYNDKYVFDFDVNQLRILISDRPELTLLDSPNNNVKELITSIHNRRCIPSEHLMELRELDVSESMNILYRLCNMIQKGYSIEHPNFINTFNRLHRIYKETDALVSTYEENYGELSRQDKDLWNAWEKMYVKLGVIERTTQFLAKRVIDVTIAFLPMKLPAYVLLWIMQWESSGILCLNEKKVVNTIQNIRNFHDWKSKMANVYNGIYDQSLLDDL